LKWSEVDLDEGLLQLDESKTGKSVRPLAVAAQSLLAPLAKNKASEFVFPADRGVGHFQGTKSVWNRAIKKAELPGGTPHTLRHTMGSTATSTGEALALTGAILGHANLRSTAIYEHVQRDPSKRAANRVGKKIAAALEGKSDGTRQSKANARNKNRTNSDKQLLRLLAQQLQANDSDADKLRAAISNSISAAA